jgi:hypothetical protein
MTRSSAMHDRSARLSLVQGIYYVGTGLWPLVSMKSFERVTGPKHDHWLVKTVGLLVTAIGTTLIRAGWRREVHPDVAALAGLSAAALATVDVLFTAQRHISPVYLLDAAPETALAAWWGRYERMAEDREGKAGAIGNEAAPRTGDRMENLMERGSHADSRSGAHSFEQDGAHRVGFGVVAVAAAVALAMAWRAYRRGSGEAIAAAEARMEPKPVVY